MLSVEIGLEQVTICILQNKDSHIKINKEEVGPRLLIGKREIYIHQWEITIVRCKIKLMLWGLRIIVEQE